MRNIDREIAGNLSFFLGGKTAEDGHRWSLNLRAVRAAIKNVGKIIQPKADFTSVHAECRQLASIWNSKRQSAGQTKQCIDCRNQRVSHIQSRAPDAAEHCTSSILTWQTCHEENRRRCWPIASQR
ncbi:Uncharacterized protein HZ326_26364, partial [Fusarium oxysporum f. sp. albedinis]